MQIRPYRTGEEAELRQLFHAAVHETASRHYSPQQCAAWAPDSYDIAAWVERIQSVNPFVVVVGDQLAGFADLQESGYIDLFFVHPRWTGKGVGRSLMQHLMSEAAHRGIIELTADVSLAAEKFFASNGFAVVDRQVVELRGQLLPNARMRYVAQAAEPGRDPL